MKKHLRVLVCLLLLTIFLVSCSGNNSGKTKDSQGTTETTGQTEKSEEIKADDPATEKKKVLRVGVTAQYKPWCYQEGEEIVGVDIDILREICKRMGDYDMEFTVTSFDGMFGLLDVGKVDTVAEQITVNEARKEKYVFSDIFAYNPYMLMVHEEDESIKSLEDLKGKKYVGPPQGQKLEFIKKHKAENDPNDEIEVLTSDNEDINWIGQKKADATVHAVAPFKQVKEESGLPLKLVGETVYTEENAYPFAKDVDKEFLESFNQALQSMKDDGFLSELYLKYFGVDISKADVEIK